MKYTAEKLQKMSAPPHQCDVVLIASFDKTEIPVHRSAIRATSKYFAALLGPNYKEGTENQISLNYIGGTTLQAIVNYCFSGRIEICANNADDILDAAASMEFPALEGMVSEFWCSRLSVENCVETLAKADQYNLTYLWEETLQFCATNFDKIPVCDMMDMDVAIFEKLIAFDKIAVIEDRIFECVVNWLHRNEKRAKFAPTILKLIRLKHISPTCFQERVRPFYRNYGHECLELVLAENENRMYNNIMDTFRTRLHRFTPADIFCTCLTRSIVNDPQIVIKKYNFELNQWSHLKTILLSGMENANRAVIINGKLFALNYSRWCYANVSILSYDLATFERTSCATRGVYRENYIPVAVDKYIYVFGGKCANGSALASCERFDTESKKWESRQPMPVPSQIDAALEWNGKIYAVHSNFLYCYDPETNSWMTASNNQNAVSDGQFSRASLVHNSNHFLYVSYYGGNTQRYDPLTNSWKMMSRWNDNTVLGTIMHHGLMYTLCQDGTFASENPETVNTKTALSKINDARISKCSFVALSAKN